MAMGAHNDHIGIQPVGLCHNGLYCRSLYQEWGDVDAFILEFFRQRLDRSVLLMKGVGPPVSHMLGTDFVSNKIGVWCGHVKQPQLAGESPRQCSGLSHDSLGNTRKVN